MIIWILFNILLFISTWHISSRLLSASIPERLTASALMSCTVLQIISWFLSIFKALTPIYYAEKTQSLLTLKFQIVENSQIYQI